MLQQAVLPGDPPIEITLRRSGRARRISLRVSSLDGRVTLTLPKGASAAEALAFAEDRAAWIRRHLARQSMPVCVGIGSLVPMGGEELQVTAAQVRSARREGDALLVPANAPMAAARVQAYLKAQARLRLTAASKHYAEALGARFSKITLRDTRSRWGSCSSQGNLMYSWRLVMAPEEVLDYVAAHEVAHLREMNHSPAFWSIVARLCPCYQPHRDWLRTQGASLHRYRFDG